MLDVANVRCCPACSSSVQGNGWFFACRDCGFLFSSLVPNIDDPARRSFIDEPERIEALRQLRSHNYRQILDCIERNGGSGTILDVGSAHGWFLDHARYRGLKPTGVEPDAAIAKGAIEATRTGYFPACLEPGERFDIIAFNDAFEHLPDVNEALSACRLHLSEGGLLSINIPSAKGLFYRAASFLRTFGVRGPFDRMWQANFVSPHMSYFDPETLANIAGKHGFVEVERQRLSSVTLHGLWARLRYDRAASIWASAAIWMAIVAAYPLIAIMPPDIVHQVFRRK